MELGRKQFANGVVCLFSNTDYPNTLSLQLKEESKTERYCFALVFFSKTGRTPSDVKLLMKNSAPVLKYAACSTAGEITPDGLTDGEILIILFPKDSFEITAFEVANRTTEKMEDVVSKVANLKSEFFKPESKITKPSAFVVCLMDGMSYLEEAVTAAVHWALDDIPMLGGSSGDNLNFKETCLILDGDTLESCAIILMFKSSLPVELFKTENFVPRAEKLVVTRSESEKRLVQEFNGLPAAKVYAETIGTDANSLTPQSFASHPLVVRVGGEYYCRSIQKVNEDGSLTFFCAIDDGVVLTVAEPTGMARSTESKMKEIETSLGEIDFVLGFDCVLRQIDARNRQVTHNISKIYKDHNVIGFNTYGEQYRSMHLNQTFTGIAFGLSKNIEADNVN